MVITNIHPQYASEKDRLGKLRDMKRLCLLKLAAAQTAKRSDR